MECFLRFYRSSTFVVDEQFSQSTSLAAALLQLDVVSVLDTLVLGRIREWSLEDSILLAIFLGEREESIQKSRNRFRTATIPKSKQAKNHYFIPEFWYRNNQNKVS
jgi:hypothetical protein